MVQNVILSKKMTSSSKNTVSAMKAICKERGLKVSGKKEELRRRIEEHDLKYNASSRIKAIWKGTHLRKWLQYQGDILGNFSSRCNNTCDFKTLDDLNDIPVNRRFAYKDKDGFQYGFHIDSFMDILISSKTISKNTTNHIIYENKPLNPYDRQEIPLADIERAVSLINHTATSRIKNKVCENGVKLNDTHTIMDYARQIEQFAIETFQRIDEHGHYTDYKWFWNLPKAQIIRLKNEIRDVFNFRTGISPETKRNILPPHGSIENIFLNTTRAYSKYFKYADALKQFEHRNHKCRIIVTTQNDIPYIQFQSIVHQTPPPPQNEPPPPPTHMDLTFSPINDINPILQSLNDYQLPESSKDYVSRIISPIITTQKRYKRDAERKYYEFLHAFLEAINTIVTSGIDRDSQALGTIYVIGSLTTVSTDAANALPWLWQSFY